MKISIAGGVASGASCAAPLRHLDEQTQILMRDREIHVICRSGQRA